MIETGFFSLSSDKGAVNAGAETNVDITCTLPQPRGMGGLSAGSWKNYTASVALTGGWFKEGDVASIETKIILQVFVGL